MARKIFLDGNADERPSPMVALLLCMIPVATFFYMKRRQRNRYNQAPAPLAETEPTRRQGKDAGHARDAEMSTEEKAKRDKEKKEWEEQVKAEKDKVEAEKSKRPAAEGRELALKKKLNDIQEELLRTRFDRDLAQHPEDPALNDPTPDEVYTQVKPLNRNPAPPVKPATRPSENGAYTTPVVKRQKSVDYIDKRDADKKAPVTDYATYRKSKAGGAGQPGLSIHDGAKFTPRDQREGWDPRPANKEKTGRERSTDRCDGQGPDQLRRKTAELRKDLSDAEFAIFSKAATVALAQPDAAEYAEAMTEARHSEYGVFPGFATAAIAAIVSVFTDADVLMVLHGMEEMKSEIKRLDQSTKDFEAFRKRYLLEATPDKANYITAWFFDSFRLVSTSTRMNIIRGEPKHLEQRMGVKFLLLEWLEIFGVRCARQRMLSPRGFDFAGLCMRSHCTRSDNANKTWQLSLTFFLPGGADRIDDKGKKVDAWGTRFSLAWASFREVWAALITETSASGTVEDGHLAFDVRELVFCPGFTFEGIKQAGGFPTQAPNNPDPSQVTRYDPVINMHEPPQYPFPGDLLISIGLRFAGILRPTGLAFLRRRQFSWAATSPPDNTHDLKDGMVAACLEMLDVTKWISDKVQKYPREMVDRSLEVRLQNDDLEIINFGSTIPMTMKGNQAIGFPDISIHPKLHTVVIAYVPITRQANGKQSAASKLPATAVLILSDKLGLKTALQDKGHSPLPERKIILYVDIKAELVQQLADELWEQFVDLGQKEHGTEWTGKVEEIQADVKALANREVLRRIQYKREDHSSAPISERMSKMPWWK